MNLVVRARRIRAQRGPQLAQGGEWQFQSSKQTPGKLHSRGAGTKEGRKELLLLFFLMPSQSCSSELPCCDPPGPAASLQYHTPSEVFTQLLSLRVTFKEAAWRGLLVQEHLHEHSRGQTGLEEGWPSARERLLGRKWGESCREE